MKRKLKGLFMVLCITLAFGACSSKDDENAGSEKTAITDTPEATQMAEPSTDDENTEKDEEMLDEAPTGDTDNSVIPEEEPSESAVPMQIEDGLEIELEESEEGAW